MKSRPRPASSLVSFEVRGYQDSRAVRYGNVAAKQRQLGSLAFFADCASIYVENGGNLAGEILVTAPADYGCASWHPLESGIWELLIEAHYVASKVMSWVVLERAVRIARLTGYGENDQHRCDG